ncbi:hypothetical protein F4810DRAFT_720279 [Camillea tinctor]|nr:hypothetical protein F4810DRAFT_720279 [Camillea tinctor]
MPVATEAPAVALSFANNFWGKDDAGVGPLLDRMASAKQTNDELRSFYSARASIEDDYARKLMSLCRKSLGSHETGSLKLSLDTVRGEVESMAKQHANIAAQMKTELEEPLAAFAGGMKERRKIIQHTVEKLLKIKIQQTQVVNKTRDRYEQECLKIKGYLAQGHMVMGQEERKNKAKLEKTQISVAASNTEYENAVKALEETTARWNREWKAAADKFQDLEEERLDFTKSSLWTFANISSTVCVSDDSSCEKIRLSLEKMDVEEDIIHFIKERGTSQEIPDPPKYINFCRGDVEDHQSEVSDEENYSVAQFPRSINPAFRTSSPQPSTFESHHDPNSALARDLSHQEPVPPSNTKAVTAPPQVPSATMPPPSLPSMPPQDRRQPENSMQQYEPPQFAVPPSKREPAMPQQRSSGAVVPVHDRRQSTKMQQQMQQHIQQQVQQQVQHQMQQHMQQQMQQQAQKEAQKQAQKLAQKEAQKQAQKQAQLQLQLEAQKQAQQEAQEAQEHDNSDFAPSPTNKEMALASQTIPSSLMPAQDRRQANRTQQYDAPQFTAPPPSRETAVATPKMANAVMSPIQDRRQGNNGSQQYDSSQFASVPHDPYPMDGMTMLCRTDGMNSATSSNMSPRPSSRDDNSEISNPTSFSSQEPPSGKVSPTKQQEPEVDAQSDKRVMKKKSGFFQNHSPFRRKSTKEIQPQPQQSNRNTWSPMAATPVAAQPSPASRRPQAYQPPEPKNLIADRTLTPEPIEANASLALNVGQNVFAVANTDNRNKSADNSPAAQEEQDPIALALAELKGAAGHKPSVGRISADRYHGLSTPVPDKTQDISQDRPQERTSMDRPQDRSQDRALTFSRPAPTRASTDLSAGLRGTPPPSYDQQITRLGVPPPAVTSKAMQEASRKYVEQTRDMFSQARPSSGSYGGTPNRPGSGAYGSVSNRPESRTYGSSTSSNRPESRAYGSASNRGSVYNRAPSRPPTRGHEVPRAASPAPPRSVSPRPDASPEPMRTNTRGSASPNPYTASPRQRSPASIRSTKRRSDQYYRHNSPNDMARSVSPAPYGGGGSNSYDRPASRNSMAMQLAPLGGDSVYGGSMRGRGGAGGGTVRPGTSSSSRGGMAGYHDDPMAQGTRQRSKSVADPSRQYTRDGRAILHYARALYMYQAAIPEELGFAKGDVLAILRHQDDGWWEAEIHSGNGVGRGGLVPSNYLQPC